MKLFLLILGICFPTLSVIVGHVMPHASGRWLYSSILIGAGLCAYSTISRRNAWGVRVIWLIGALGAMLLFLMMVGSVLIRESGLIGTQ